MRNGEQAVVAGVNENAHGADAVVGWRIGRDGAAARCWTISGRYVSDRDNSDYDLVSEWVETVPWDWSTTPPWINYVAMDIDLEWMLYSDKPKQAQSGWRTEGPYCAVPPAFWPKWSGDWKQSLTVRPGYKESK